MKTQSTFFLQTLGKTQLENLVKEVKETLAVDAAVTNQERTFSSADLWNMERNRKARSIRRHLA